MAGEEAEADGEADGEVEGEPDALAEVLGLGEAAAAGAAPSLRAPAACPVPFELAPGLGLAVSRP